MKKFIVISFAFLALAACGGGDSKESKDDKKDNGTEEKKENTDLSSNPDYQKGLELIIKNDCLGCHKVDEKIQGPTYRDVANKYASMPDTIIGHLAKKIISGGAGVWADFPLMTPHPALSEEDAKAMVKYILLLKN
ncbi:MAG: c-type cytochrome [Chitinophagales bacterium]